MVGNALHVSVDLSIENSCECQRPLRDTELLSCHDLQPFLPSAVCAPRCVLFHVPIDVWNRDGCSGYFGGDLAGVWGRRKLWGNVHQRLHRDLQSDAGDRVVGWVERTVREQRGKFLADHGVAVDLPAAGRIRIDSRSGGCGGYDSAANAGCDRDDRAECDGRQSCTG